MKEQYLFDPIPCDKYDLLSKEEVIKLYEGEQDLNLQMRSYINELEKKYLKSEQKSFLLGEQLIHIKHRIFGASSEKSKRKDHKIESRKSPKKRVLLPSERYPEAKIIEKDVTLDKDPICPCCQKEMKDSGLTEDSEYLTVIPKQVYIVRQKRHKYRCGKCYEGLITAPAIPRIKAGSSYSDEMVVDVALSKYCDLIPIERYVQMSARSGISGLPANSLIQTTHHLADFVMPVYDKIKNEVFSNEIIHGDETPHRMLEGDKKSSWYLWGFSTLTAAYFEAQNTRSGDVAIDLIKDSSCKFLVSDVFSGYNRTVRESNIYRKEKDQNLPLIKNVYCNAHARRKLKEIEKSYDSETKLLLWCYKKIYGLEKRVDFKRRREWQRFYFKIMQEKCLRLKSGYSSKGKLVQAINYFVNHYDDFTLFLNYDNVPIDNNPQERLMRSPVIGRKTWYGTHSKRGAKTNSILFTLVESCKLNKVNPREYFKELIVAIHEKRPIFTPNEYKPQKLEKSS